MLLFFICFVHLLSNASICPSVGLDARYHHPLIVFTCSRFPGIALHSLHLCVYLAVFVWLRFFRSSWSIFPQPIHPSISFSCVACILLSISSLVTSLYLLVTYEYLTYFSHLLPLLFLDIVLHLPPFPFLFLHTTCYRCLLDPRRHTLSYHAYVSLDTHISR